MSLIEGIGNEVTHFFILLLVAILVYIGWISTSTSDRQIRSVLLLDRTWNRNRRVLRVLIPRLHGLGLTEAVIESEGTSSTAASSTTVITERSEEDSNPLNDTADNTDGNSSIVAENQSQVENAEKEESSIIEAMDADENDQSELRQRRITRFESPESATAEPNSEITNDDSESITIKLKYSNDDIRIVDGKLEETLGHFRRHFTHEFTANKEVKLIFNGHILKQNLHSLRKHGIFNNCVVHCLVYPKRTPSNNDRALEIVESSSNYLPNVDFPHINVNNNNQGIDWDLTNFLYTAASVLLLAAWYFRYVYSNLYTIPATVGLTILTALFSLVILGTFLPNDDFLATETNGSTRIRVSRVDSTTTEPQPQSPIINNS